MTEAYEVLKDPEEVRLRPDFLSDMHLQFAEIKKEKNDFEDISSTGSTNVKQVHDRIVKTLNTIRKLNN